MKYKNDQIDDNNTPINENLEHDAGSQPNNGHEDIKPSAILTDLTNDQLKEQIEADAAFATKNLTEYTRKLIKETFEDTIESLHDEKKPGILKEIPTHYHQVITLVALNNLAKLNSDEFYNLLHKLPIENHFLVQFNTFYDFLHSPNQVDSLALLKKVGISMDNHEKSISTWFHMAILEYIPKLKLQYEKLREAAPDLESIVDSIEMMEMYINNRKTNYAWKDTLNKINNATIAEDGLVALGLIDSEIDHPYSTYNTENLYDPNEGSADSDSDLDDLDLEVINAISIEYESSSSSSDESECESILLYSDTENDEAYDGGDEKSSTNNVKDADDSKHDILDIAGKDLQLD